MDNAVPARDDAGAPAWTLAPSDRGAKEETRVQRLETELEVARATIRRLAGRNGIDPLTGLLNREAIGRCLDLEIRRAQRHGRDLAVLLLDVNHVMALNEEKGPDRGDDVLRALAAHIRATTRATDSIGRARSDEFLVVCPETDAAGAVRVAENLTGNTAKRTILIAGSKVTLSVWIGVVPVVPGMTTADVVQCAEQALERAKKSGGSRWSL